MATNYEAGRRFEYKRMKVWRANGAVVMRTAGSHGPFDLIAICDGEVVLIQCKRVKSEAAAWLLIGKFKKKPPLEKGWYHQHIEVYVTSTRETLVGVAPF